MTLPAILNTALLDAFNDAPAPQTGAYNLIKFKSSSFSYIIDGLEVPSEDIELKCIIVDVAPVIHRVMYAGAYVVDTDNKDQPDRLCMSNNGVVPTTWSQPIIGPNGARVLTCRTCHYASKDAKELYGNKCSGRQIIYVIPAEYPDRIFALDVASAAVFFKGDKDSKFTGLREHLKGLNARLANVPHPVASTHPEYRIKSSYRTVWSYLASGKTVQNSYGFSAYSCKRNASQDFSFVTAEDYVNMLTMYNDPEYSEAKNQPRFSPQTETASAELPSEITVSAEVPAPPAKRPAPQDIVDVGDADSWLV